MTTATPVKKTYIHTVAPIGIDALTRKFTEEGIVFVVDYTKSKIKGMPFLTYLSNVDVSCHVQMETPEEWCEALQAYLKTTTLLRLPELEDMAIQVLMAAKGLPYGLTFDPSAFIAANQESIDKWLQRLDSLMLYSVYCLDPQAHQGYVDSFPQDDTEDMVGCNFVHLIDHPHFVSLMSKVDESKLTWYSEMFVKPIYRNNSLFKYWGVPENPFFQVGVAMLDEEFKPEEFVALIEQDRLAMSKAQPKSEVSDVSSV